MYTGVKNATQHSVGATFNNTEDYSKKKYILVKNVLAWNKIKKMSVIFTVFLPDNSEKNSSIACWDTRTTEKLKTLPSGNSSCSY